MLSILINLLLAVHVIVSLLIVLIVLMQRPKNEGLGAAFGGGMTDNMFGAQTTHVLAKITRWLGGLFFILTLTLSVLYAKQSREEDAVSQKLRSAPVPAAAATPAVSPSPGVPAPGLQSISAETFEPAPAEAEITPAPTETDSATPVPIEAATPAPAPAEPVEVPDASDTPARPDATPAS